MYKRFRGVVLASALVAALCSAASAGKFNAVLSVGDKAPAWEALPATDGKSYAMADFEECDVLVVVFIANHCPMSSAYEERLLAFDKEYVKRSVRLVAVSVSTQPGDSLERMKERAAEKGFGFSYLHDATQKIGHDYGASVTPEVFVLNRERRVVYLGPWDDSSDVAKVRKHLVRDAVEAVLAGKTPPVGERRPRGCEIHYQEKNTDLRIEPMHARPRHPVGHAPLALAATSAAAES